MYGAGSVMDRRLATNLRIVEWLKKEELRLRFAVTSGSKFSVETPQNRRGVCARYYQALIAPGLVIATRDDREKCRCRTGAVSGEVRDYHNIGIGYGKYGKDEYTLR